MGLPRQTLGQPAAEPARTRAARPHNASFRPRVPSEAESSKYFLSTLQEDTSINELVDVAHRRLRIERDYQVLKQDHRFPRRKAEPHAVVEQCRSTGWTTAEGIQQRSWQPVRRVQMDAPTPCGRAHRSSSRRSVLLPDMGSAQQGPPWASADQGSVQSRRQSKRSSKDSLSTERLVRARRWRPVPSESCEPHPRRAPRPGQTARQPTRLPRAPWQRRCP